MKKLVFMFAVTFAMTMVSCGNKTAQSSNADTASVDTAVVDTTATDSTVCTD